MDFSSSFGSNSSVNFSQSVANSSFECIDMNDYYWQNRHDLTTRPAVMRTFAALYATIILLGVVGNACVVIAIARVKSLQARLCLANIREKDIDAVGATIFGIL
ncbi:hypothetical protein niasHS_014672 [Heterodera schachtii]|uniref:Uncharacterized protein n=1 Tax=Heterodera schachtii TaxID=97005 RepID=A0ABD2IM23_HETSC